MEIYHVVRLFPDGDGYTAIDPLPEMFADLDTAYLQMGAYIQELIDAFNVVRDELMDTPELLDAGFDGWEFDDKYFWENVGGLVAIEAVEIDDLTVKYTWEVKSVERFAIIQYNLIF